MGTWIGAYLSLPLVLLSGLFMLKVVRDSQKAYARMSFKSLDVRISLQMMIAGFTVLAFSRIFDVLGFESLDFLVSVFAGSMATVLLTGAFLILNIVVYGPENRFYYRLPSNYLGDEDRYIHR